MKHICIGFQKLMLACCFPLILQEILVHSSNCLATKALKDGKKHIGFVKSCIAFSEITIPSIPGHIKQLNLYLGTAEVRFPFSNKVCNIVS